MLVVGGIVLTLLVGACALVLVGVVRATHQARSAADLAVLAGAQTLARGATARAACARANAVAGSNGATLRVCSADEGSGVVVVEVTAPVAASAAAGLGLTRLGPASSRARAGPATLTPAGLGVAER